MTQEKTKVFVVWDSKVPIATTLEDLMSDPTCDLHFDALCIRTADNGGVIPDNVRTRIESAHRVLAVMNRANANVLFEVGTALALEKPVTLIGWAENGRPAWMGASPPLATLAVQGVHDDAEVTKHARAGQALPTWRKPGADGAGVLVLCPRKQAGSSCWKRVHGHRAAPHEAVFNPLGESDFNKLAPYLEGVKRVVWIVPHMAPGDGNTDAPEVAAAALLAGYAHALGREVVLLRHVNARDLLDARHLHREWETLEDLTKLLDALFSVTAEATPPPLDPLVTYRESLRIAHAPRRLLPFFANAAHSYVDETFVVPVEVKGDAGDGHAHRGPIALRDLLAGDAQARWLIRGEPGAGKSTLARYLTYTLAAATDDGPVAVFASIPRMVAQNRDPFALAEADLGTDGAGLATALRDRARSRPGAVWLLLDGLDEVYGTEEQRDAALTRLLRLAADADLRGTPMVVFTRPKSVPGLEVHFRPAALDGLTPEAQRRLLDAWLKDSGFTVDAALEKMRARPYLAPLASNPLMLTLIAYLVRAHNALPPTRPKLYVAAVDAFLKRSWVEGDGTRRVGDVGIARDVLAEVALRLHGLGRDRYTEDQVNRALRALRRENADLSRDIETIWKTNDAFFENVFQVSGLFGPVDGAGNAWGFLHRSFREFLAARALVNRAVVEAVKAVTEAVEVEEAQASAGGWWGEVTALLAGLMPDPRPLLEALHATDADLATRIVMNSDDLDPVAAVEFLTRTDEWDADALCRLVQLHAQQGDDRRYALLGWLWPKVTAGVDDTKLGALGNALELCGVDLMAGADRARFFHAAGRPAPTDLPAERFAAIPGGTFLMGSPKDEEGRFDDEGPQHNVTVSAFSMMRTPVTVADFKRFGQDRKSRNDKPDFPVTEVTWWSAWLFARWSGATLPTEAQWEYACRGGTTTRFWSGDDEADLAKVGWYSKNSKGTLHAVGLKKAPAHPWGLLDLHGLVWEWCLDGLRPYGEAAVNDATGPFYGVLRAVRGGACGLGAGGCRSAYRGVRHPGGVRVGLQGLRLVRPPPPPPPPTLDP